ncbi:MAG: Nif3-like dinuclear metal center hexameric protein, partial [Bacteroidales bacterium]|nr:Nif3-like dinuclear metal center hexameric protein [Bacteroidales bacterium]
MILSEVIKHIETIAPHELQESWDNSGLIVGNTQQEITQVLACLDVTEKVVMEAIQNNCQLILSHHPLIFKGIRQIVDNNNYIQHTITLAIKHNIAIYAAHTSLDNSPVGINAFLAQKMGLTDIQILVPKENCLYKLVTYVPQDYENKVKEALFKSGAGEIGNYSSCSYNIVGMGTFMANKNAHPFV